MTTTHSIWSASYFDGRTAASRQVRLELHGSSLQVEMPDGSRTWWPYDQVRQTQGFHRGEKVCLIRGQTGKEESIVVEDTAFLTALHLAAPDFRHRFHNPRNRLTRRHLTWAAGLVVVAVAALVYAGIPALAEILATRIPVSWEERLGEVLAAQLAPLESRCESTAVIDGIVSRLTEHVEEDEEAAPYTFRLIVVDDDMVNAFAAPGGYIVVFRGLLERTGSAEEFAGVLAHEMQHVVRRHGTKTLFRQLSTRALIAVFSGDLESVGTMLETAEALGGLRYRRQDETEADREGMRLIQRARLDPTGMITFFSTLEQAAPEMPVELGYLSTHPLVAERVAALEELAGRITYKPEALAPGTDWSQQRNVCGEVDRGE